MDEILTGGGLILSGGALTLIINALLKVWSARNQKNEIGPQPFEVKTIEQWVSRADCMEHRRAIDQRQHDLNQEVSAERANLSAQLSAIRNDLTENDKRAEERSRNLHKRLDPIVEAVGTLKGRVDDHINARRKTR